MRRTAQESCKRAGPVCSVASRSKTVKLSVGRSVERTMLLRPCPPLCHARFRAGLAEATTQTTAAERDAIARYAAGRQRLVEVGVWHGVTTKRLRAAMAADGERWAVDPYVRGHLGMSFSELIARREVATVANGTVRWMRETSVAAAARFRREAGRPVDFVFIDGDHSWEGIRTDSEAWSGLVGIGGVVGPAGSRRGPERRTQTTGRARYTKTKTRPARPKRPIRGRHRPDDGRTAGRPTRPPPRETTTPRRPVPKRAGDGSDNAPRLTVAAARGR